MRANAGIIILPHHSESSKVIEEPGLNAGLVTMKSVRIIKNVKMKNVVYNIPPSLF